MPYIAFDNTPRPITDGETQLLILSEIESVEKNKMIPLAVRLLMIYLVRPGQLTSITYKDVNFDRGGITVIRKGKKGRKKQRFVPMLDEDVDLFRSLPSGFPDALVFRSSSGNSLNTNILSKAWRRAIARLKKRGLLPEEFDVDLYRGTRSTSISRIEGVSPEELRKTTGHQTTEAFDHYMRWEDSDKRKVFKKTSVAKHGTQTGHMKSAYKFEIP
jgi:integrase